MPTSRNPYERMEFWRQKDNGTLYMTEEQLRQRVGELMDEVNDLRRQLADLQFSYDIRGDTLTHYEGVIEELYLENQRLAEASSWTPVDFIKLVDGLEIHVDNIALTIGKADTDTALATHQWPEDGYEYMICQRTPGTSAQEVEPTAE